jgi:hypothetical protein
MRYVKDRDLLRSGQFGTVYKAINVDLRKFITVKIIKQLVSASKQEHKE